MTDVITNLLSLRRWQRKLC